MGLRSTDPVASLPTDLEGLLDSHAEIRGFVGTRLAGPAQTRFDTYLGVVDQEDRCGGQISSSLLDSNASRLELEPSAVTMRYRRALERLRQKLPGSVFDDLREPDDDEEREKS